MTCCRAKSEERSYPHSTLLSTACSFGISPCYGMVGGWYDGTTLLSQPREVVNAQGTEVSSEEAAMLRYLPPNANTRRVL